MESQDVSEQDTGLAEQGAGIMVRPSTMLGEQQGWAQTGERDWGNPNQECKGLS